MTTGVRIYSSKISGQQLHKMASQNDMVQDDKNQQMQQLQQVQQQQMQQQMKQQIQQQVQAMQAANPIQQSGQKKKRLLIIKDATIMVLWIE